MGFPSFGLDYGDPDFVEYAGSFGARGHRVERTKYLVPQRAESLGEPGLHQVDAPRDDSENEQVLTEQLKARTCPMA